MHPAASERETTAPRSPPRQSMRLRKKRLHLLSLAALFPIRSLLHLLLTDEDAARLLRVGRTVATSLLSGYTFHQHVFEPASVQEMRRLKALCEAYDVRPTRMCVPVAGIAEMGREAGSGGSPFPSSLTSLVLGSVAPDEDGHIAPHRMFSLEADRVDSIQCLWTHPRSAMLDEQYHDLLMEEHMSPVFSYTELRSQVNYSLPPGLLPHGLRRLQLDSALNSPLQAGSIPSTVEVLHVSGDLDNSLSIERRGPSLVHLVLLGGMHLPLTANVLPASLQRLGWRYYDHPLDVGVLPSTLQALDMYWFHQPIKRHDLPAGLTHLSFFSLNHPLTPGILPSSLVSLDLGASFQHPLPPHVLPSSLRVFFHSRVTSHPLQPGVLPEGLVALHWRLYTWASSDPLLPGVLPSPLRVLDMGRDWVGDIAAGAVPDGVRWLRLPAHMHGKEVEQRLPANALVEWEVKW